MASTRRKWKSVWDRRTLNIVKKSSEKVHSWGTFEEWVRNTTTNVIKCPFLRNIWGTNKECWKRAPKNSVPGECWGIEISGMSIEWVSSVILTICNFIVFPSSSIVLIFYGVRLKMHKDLIIKMLRINFQTSSTVKQFSIRMKQMLYGEWTSSCFINSYFQNRIQYYKMLGD